MKTDLFVRDTQPRPSLDPSEAGGAPVVLSPGTLPPPAHLGLQDSTKDAYARALTRIQRAVAQQGSAPGRPGYYHALVDWLLLQAPRIRPGTWMVRRGALRNYLQLEGTQDALDADSRLVELSPRDGFKGVRAGTTQRLYASASTRRRHVLVSQMRLLTRELAFQARPRKGDRLDPSSLVAVGLRAFLAAGLRPSEWPRAGWVDSGSLLLRVRNAKRRHAPQTLPRMVEAPPPPDSPRERIVRIDPEDRMWVDLFLSYVARGSARKGGYKAFYDAMDRKRYEVCRDLGIDITFYMARGQFGADRKKRFGLAATALEMGNSPRKASSYYGPIGKARPGMERSKEASGDRQRLDEAPTPETLPTASGDNGVSVDTGFF
jgi:hypothetical protein